jgi:hypothetical protein
MAHDLALMIATILFTFLIMDSAFVVLFVRYNYSLCAICETQCTHFVLFVRHKLSRLLQVLVNNIVSCVLYFLDY